MIHVSGRCALLGLATVALALHSAPAAAQPNRARFGSDSTAWQRVLTKVVERLSTELVQAASDTSASPWRIELPHDEPQRPLLEAQLRAILRARAPIESDTVVRTLKLGPLRIEKDTARVDFQYWVSRRCPGTTQTTGYGNHETFVVPRDPTGFWHAPRSISVTHGDRVGCRR